MSVVASPLATTAHLEQLLLAVFLSTLDPGTEAILISGPRHNSQDERFGNETKASHTMRTLATLTYGCCRLHTVTNVSLTESLHSMWI